MVVAGLDDGEELQANIHQVFFNTIDKNPGLVQGAYLWDTMMASESAYRESFGQLRGTNARGRLAEEVVRATYAAWRQKRGICPTHKLSGFSPPLPEGGSSGVEQSSDKRPVVGSNPTVPTKEPYLGGRDPPSTGRLWVRVLRSPPACSRGESYDDPANRCQRDSGCTKFNLFRAECTYCNQWDRCLRQRLFHRAALRAET